MTRPLLLENTKRHFIKGELVRLVDKTVCRPVLLDIPVGAIAIVMATNDTDPYRVSVKFFEPLGAEALTWAGRFEKVVSDDPTP